MTKAFPTGTSSNLSKPGPGPGKLNSPFMTNAGAAGVTTSSTTGGAAANSFSSTTSRLTGISPGNRVKEMNKIFEGESPPLNAN